jgi:hypothetical protein
MERDTELKRAFGSYVLIGEALRAPGGTTASHGFAARVQAELDDGANALPAALGSSPAPRSPWLKSAAALAVAAGAAFAAVLLMRPDGQVEEPAGVSGVAALVDAAAVPGAILDFAADDSQSQRLAGYLVAHSQFATPIGRRNVWTSVLAQDPGIAHVVYETAEGP